MATRPRLRAPSWPVSQSSESPAGSEGSTFHIRAVGLRRMLRGAFITTTTTTPLRPSTAHERAGLHVLVLPGGASFALGARCAHLRSVLQARCVHVRGPNRPLWCHCAIALNTHGAVATAIGKSRRLKTRRRATTFTSTSTSTSLHYYHTRHAAVDLVVVVKHRPQPQFAVTGVSHRPAPSYRKQHTVLSPWHVCEVQVLGAKLSDWRPPRRSITRHIGEPGNLGTGR